MGKKAVIVVTLVEESEEKANTALKKEIFDELSNASSIPWMKEVEKVQIVEN